MAEVDYGELSFTVRRFALARLVDQAVVVIPTGHLIQEVFGCFQDTVRAGWLQLAGTNMVQTVWAETASVTTQGEGVFYLPARKLRALLAEAPDGDVTVAVKRNHATVTAGAASWTLKLPPGTRYPVLLDLAGVAFEPVGRKELLGALSVVRHAVGKDTGRPQYTQVGIAAWGKVMCASAWDSGQFARAPVPGFPFPCGIPASVLDDLCKLLAAGAEESAAAGQTEGALAFRLGPVTLAVLKHGKEFALSDKHLAAARANELELEADKAELLAAIRRVRINADAETSAIALELEAGRLTLVARDKDDNGARETIGATWGGGPRQLIVNGGFLYAMLDVHPAASCRFRVGRDPGRQRSHLLLADEAAGVYGVIPQMLPQHLGY